MTEERLVEDKFSSQAHSQQQHQDGATDFQELDMQNLEVFVPLNRVGYSEIPFSLFIWI